MSLLTSEKRISPIRNLREETRCEVAPHLPSGFDNELSLEIKSEVWQLLHSFTTSKSSHRNGALRHVQYAHHWLPLVAQFTGMEGDDFKAWGENSRREAKAKMKYWLHNKAKALDRSPDNADFALYQQFLERMQQIKPLSNAETCPPRFHLTMYSHLNV